MKNDFADITLSTSLAQNNLLLDSNSASPIAFPNNQNNQIQGFNHLNDAIDGQGGDDRMAGQGCDDIVQGQCLTPFQRKLLLKSLQTDLRPEYRRRIEIMLLADTGQSQAEICKAVGCSPEMARYWIAITQSGQAHHWSDHPMGRPKTVNEQYCDRLKELVNHSPREYDYPFQRWTAQWLAKHLAKELGIDISACHINRLLKQMGLSTRTKNDTAETLTDSIQHSKITIRDLQPPSLPDFSRSALTLEDSLPLRDHNSLNTRSNSNSRSHYPTTPYS